MATTTIAEAQTKHRQAIETNQDLGVVSYTSGEKQSEAVYEVIEGYKRLPGKKVLGPGQRFHPTERQVATGSLRGKARELTNSEYRGLRTEPKVFAGADFAAMERKAAWDALPMADSTREAAQAAGMVPEDFTGVEPSGAAGRYTRLQVDEMIEARGRD